MRGKERRWKIVALLAVGIAIGVAMTATPAVGHVSGWVHNWNRHIKPRADARYYRKALADARYYNVGETAANAANADKLDNLDSTAFLRSTLPAGQMLSGSYASWGTGDATGGFHGDSIFFRIPLASDIPGANAEFIPSGGAFTTNCPGFGQAATGFVCVYERTFGNRTFGTIHRSEGGIDPGAGRNGFWIWFSVPAAGGSWSYGEWAVKAPAGSPLSRPAFGTAPRPPLR